MNLTAINKLVAQEVEEECWRFKIKMMEDMAQHIKGKVENTQTERLALIAFDMNQFYSKLLIQTREVLLDLVKENNELKEQVRINETEVHALPEVEIQLALVGGW